MVPFPTVIGDYWSSVAFWWDVEFWNASVVRSATLRDRFVTTPRSFPQTELWFDPRTGRANVSPTRHVAYALADTRFRIAGRSLEEQRGLRLTDAERPWRAAWVGTGLWDDGWTRPRRPARFRVFAAPEQSAPVQRFLTLRLRAPPGQGPLPYAAGADGAATSGSVGVDAVTVQVPVCVRPDAPGVVTLTVDADVPIPVDLTDLTTAVEPRRGGAQVVEVALADEVGGRCGPRP
jgi:hypothetical protein